MINPLAQDVFEACKSAGMKLAFAESCTGGLVSGSITDIAGSSAVFDRGFVTYSNEAKSEMLNVSAKTLKDFGAVSEEVAIEMAQGALKNSNADIAVSITGIAGPGGSEHKPEGRVCFAVCQENANPVVETMEFGALGRAEVRRASVDHALSLLLANI